MSTTTAANEPTFFGYSALEFATAPVVAGTSQRAIDIGNQLMGEIAGIMGFAAQRQVALEMGFQNYAPQQANHEAKHATTFDAKAAERQQEATLNPR